jgi:hypothetical protein
VPLRDEKTVRGRMERKPERNWDMIVIAMALPIYTPIIQVLYRARAG